MSAERTGKKRIVPAEVPIVLGEPNNYNRAMLNDVLRSLGYTKVYPATSGEEILESMSLWSPELVILENLLPDISGTELVHRFRREEILRDRKVPVIMVTSDPRSEVVQEARIAGIDEFAAKPISHALIKQRIEECLLRPRPFIEAKKYVGPCRRRKRNFEYRGSLKRGSDSGDVTDKAPDMDMNRRMLDQCAGRLNEIAQSIDPADRAGLRSLYNTAREANEIAKQLRDQALELATECVLRYIEGVAAHGKLQANVITTHMAAIRLLLTQKTNTPQGRLEVAQGLQTIVRRKLREVA